MEIATALIHQVSELIETSRQKVAVSVNAELTLLYWRIGHLLQSEIATGGRADYGQQVVASLSRSLTQQYGRGWGKRHLHYCIRLSEAFPEEIVHTVCAQLSWSHLRLLVSMDEPQKRAFYVQMATTEHWSVRQLNERIQSMLFERTAISRKPEETIELELAKLGDQKLSTDLILKDPYLLDFLGLNDHYLERDLEDAILRELEQFLLELGSGFTFVARQKRLQIDDDDFYLDLLFYNRKLKRLVVIDLKIGDFRPEYKGQMELYLRWLARHEQEPGEEAPLGIILCAGKKQEQIELLELDKSGIHVAEYLTVLPPRDILQARFRRAIETAQLSLEAKDAQDA